MVTASFKEGQKTAITTSLQKYDYGEVLRIKGLSLPRYVAVQFAVDGMSEALPSSIGETVEDVTDVLIPNSLLRSNIKPWNYNIMAYVYIVSGSSGKTEYTITIPVKWRPKTGDDQAADDDVAAVIGSAVEKMNTATTKAENAANQASATAEEIKADREKITTNEIKIAGLKSDIINIPIGYTDILDSMVDADNLIYNYTSGNWVHIDKKITLNAGNYILVLYEFVRSEVGYFCIFKDKINGETIISPKYDNGKYEFTLSETTTLILSMQVSNANTVVSEGTYRVRYSIYRNDSTIIPKWATGLDKVDINVFSLYKLLNAIDSSIKPVTKHITQNLINFDSITYDISDSYSGCFISRNGILTANQYSSAYCVTDYIKIDKNGLTINKGVGNVYAVLYDNDLKFIQGSAVELRNKDIYHIPYVKGAVYAKFTLLWNSVQTYCIVKGEKPFSLGTDEIAFNDKLRNAMTGMMVLSAVTPERLVLQNGKQSVLYMENMLKNTNILPKSISQTLMTNIGNIAYTTPSSDVVNNSITYHFEDCLGRKVDETKKYSIVSTPSKESLNILCIGDSFTDIGTYVETIKNDIEDDGISVNLIGNMGVNGKRHEARSGGTWDFVTTRQGRAIIVNVTGISNLPTTGYPGTTYQDANGFKWSIRGVVIDSNGNGKLILGNFNVDSNYGGSSSGTTTDADTASDNIPSSGTLTKTSNASTGSTT